MNPLVQERTGGWTPFTNGRKSPSYELSGKMALKLVHDVESRFNVNMVDISIPMNLFLTLILLCEVLSITLHNPVDSSVPGIRDSNFDSLFASLLSISLHHCAIIVSPSVYLLRSVQVDVPLQIPPKLISCALY